jgi:hypothetical protein
MKHTRGAGSPWLLGAGIAVVLAVSMIFFGAGAATRTAKAASASNGLFAYIAPTTRGPLPACLEDGSNCTPANTVWNFIHVVNSNRLTPTVPFGTNRGTVPNAFVVSSIDQRIFVNGVEVPTFASSFTPAPNPTPFRSWSGRWPSTVTCPSDGSACNVVGNPAVVPGENPAVLYAGWVHGDAEPNGTYVFKYTIHGTLNGNPVDLNASSPSIEMTS